VAPLYASNPPTAVKTVAVLPDAQLKVELATPQAPLEDFKVKPEPEAVAVYVAQVPLVYQVPAEIKQPPPDASKKPVPEKVPGVPVGEELTEVPVPVAAAPDLGRYLIPVLGQEPVCPTGAEGMKVPSCTEPWT